MRSGTTGIGATPGGFWEDWEGARHEQRDRAACQFAQRLKPYLTGILAHTRWPLGTNLVEGINNRIKVLKRMSYGFRDDHYFFLKIRAVLPRNSAMNHSFPARKRAGAFRHKGVYRNAEDFS